MVELVDTLDLKSNDHYGRAGSSPASSTKPLFNLLIIRGFLFYNIYLYGICMVKPQKFGYVFQDWHPLPKIKSFFFFEVVASVYM